MSRITEARQLYLMAEVVEEEEILWTNYSGLSVHFLYVP